jgi:DNA repair exonuclease SbcCD ATPase subunit
MESGHACPICQEEFNPEIEERTPFKFCEESHFLCKGCIRNYIAGLSSPREIKDYNRVGHADQNFRGFKLECPARLQVHCPVCRCSIHPEYRSDWTSNVGTQIFRFPRDRIFDQMISSKSSMEPSMALEERHKVKTQLDKTHGDFVSFMQSSLNLEPMYQNLKKLKEDYERLMSSQEQSVQEFDSKIDQKVKVLKKLESDVKEQEQVLNQLIKQEPLLKAEYKRQEITERKKQIDATVEKYGDEIISKHKAEIALLKELHHKLIVEVSKRNAAKIDELDCYKAGLRFQKKQILDTFIRDNSSEAERLIGQKLELENEIKGYETQISKLSSDVEHVLKTAMEKHGFDPDYLSKEQQKYEREAADLRIKIIEEARIEANAEKNRIRKEVYETKQGIEEQIRDWGTSRKEFKRFLALKKGLGEQRAEMAFSPLNGGKKGNQEVETTFWRMLAEYEKIPDPTYKLSEYIHWKEQKRRTGNYVDEFLMKQRMIYGFK